MTKELSEDSKFKISIKTLAWIIAGVATVIAGYYGMLSNINTKFVELEQKVQEALEKPKPGTGTYTIDMGDPAASQTWPPTRMEFNMKDQMARDKIDNVIKEVEELKEELKELRK
jgi:pyruvate/oxaloacetate carboxyltransferase|tara:strand:- start:2108 stop:2452 length:345 start_codon:yes stop_codon:yes gene_type:complete